MTKTTQHNESFTTVKPLSEKISRYISYYYFHASEDENYQKSFIFYPNYKHALTVYKDSEITLKDNESVINPSEKTDIQPLYAVNKNKNMKVSMKGSFDKIGIVFNPLGINHFIEKPLQEAFTDNFGFFPYFGDDFTQVIEQVFSEKEINKKALFLDEFFEQKYISFTGLTLKRAIGEIIVSNGAIKVSELSRQLNVNRKTLLRLFKKHTNMSVEEYRKMVMFRQALNYFHQNKETTNLTDVALFSMYYDQAHFIKHFKSITKETPTTLLSKISHLGEEDTYWYFEE